MKEETQKEGETSLEEGEYNVFPFDSEIAGIFSNPRWYPKWPPFL